jgi:hypothetical protein
MNRYGRQPIPKPNRLQLKGTGFSPYINQTKESGALAPEGVLVKGTGLS